MRTTYRFSSPNPWDTDWESDEEDYEEDYGENYGDSDEQSDGEDSDESNEEEAEDSDEENDQENDEESNEEENEENDEESDKESVPDLVENTGETSAEKLAAELPPAPFKCQDCDEAFYYTAALGEHQEMFAHGPMAIREKKPEPAAGPSAPEFKKGRSWQWAAEKNKAVEKPAEKPTIEDKAGNASVSVYKCTDCGRLYRDVNLFQVHLGQNHGRHPTYYNRYLTKVTPEETDAPVKKVTSGFRCRPCNEPFRNQHLLVVHWETKHKDAWFALFDQDNISDESLSYSDFQNFDNYDEDDMLDDLRQINSRSSKKNTIHCMTCWRKFRTTSQMVEHVEMGECHSYISTRSIKWAIGSCDRSVVSRCYSDTKFQCSSCEARFDPLSSLGRHVEGNKCHADVTRGPLKAFITEVRWRMIGGELF
ncbi:zinc finger domain-containing protein [Fusarium pseudocircinatum]|uniref:Zinc finger domain-containing protein n=1 Tax=Fusarium pseudocircinatum TaxID=56676 RepID=A0A8H5PZC9_9HYPO|nr:zinc finger domain-containing protein [Fusarium pseudocircinatum]